MQHLFSGRTAPSQLPWARGIIPIVVSLIVLWLLRAEIEQFDLNLIMQTVVHFSAVQWLLAGLLTIASFYAIAQYDRLMAEYIGLNLPRKAVVYAGWRATAIGQVLGYGLVTGALTRWRALGRPYDISLWDCSKLTAAVTLSFFAGWAAVASLCVVLSQLPELRGWPNYIAFLALILLSGVAFASMYRPDILQNRVPPLRIIVPTLGYTALDTLAACAILYLFLPEGYAPFFLLYTSFLLALSAGMISGLPGGLGAFEICLLTLIAPSDPEPLLSAIFGYRFIYYAAPAIVAAVSLIPVQAKRTKVRKASLSSRHTTELQRFAPPEAELITQGLLSVHQAHKTLPAVLWHRSRNTDLVLQDPFGEGNVADCISELQVTAKHANRGLLIYKCGEDAAKTVKELGGVALRIGSDAIVKPTEFNSSGPVKRQLRRKLRKAEKAQVIIGKYNTADFAELERIDAVWQKNSGPAQGFSMGYLSHALIARQLVLTASLANKMVAYITIMKSADKWSLDLIRTASNCPDGTVHALVCAAIERAADQNIPEFSLAAAPAYLQNKSGLSDHLVGYAFNQSGHLRGLAQFKSCFAPEWRPYYVCSSSFPTVILGALDLYHLIKRPSCPTHLTTSEAHNDYQFYEFDSSAMSCHAHQRMTHKDNSHERSRHYGHQRVGTPPF